MQQQEKFDSFIQEFNTQRPHQAIDIGRICIKKKKVNLSRVFAGQDVGVKETDDGIWLVTFMDYD